MLESKLNFMKFNNESQKIEMLSEAEFYEQIINTVFEFQETDTLSIEELTHSFMAKYPSLTAHTDSTFTHLKVSHTIKKDIFDKIVFHFNTLKNKFNIKPLIVKENGFELPGLSIIKDKETDNVYAKQWVESSPLYFSEQQIQEGMHWQEATHTVPIEFKEYETIINKTIQATYTDYYTLAILYCLYEHQFFPQYAELFDNHNYHKLLLLANGSTLGFVSDLCYAKTYLLTSYKNTQTSIQYVKKLPHYTEIKKTSGLYHKEATAPSVYGGSLFLYHKNRAYHVGSFVGTNRNKSKRTIDVDFLLKIRVSDMSHFSFMKKDVRTSLPTLYIIDFSQVYILLAKKEMNFFKKFKWSAIFGKNIKPLIDSQAYSQAFKQLKLIKQLKLSMDAPTLATLNKMTNALDTLIMLQKTNSKLFLWFMRYFDSMNNRERIPSAYTPHLQPKNELTLNAVKELKQQILAQPSFHMTEKDWKFFLTLNGTLTHYLMRDFMSFTSLGYKETIALAGKQLHMIRFFKEHKQDISLLFLNRVFYCNTRKDIVKKLYEHVVLKNKDKLSKTLLIYIVEQYALAKKKRTVNGLADNLSLIFDYLPQLEEERCIELLKRKTAIGEFIRMHHTWVEEQNARNKLIQDNLMKFEWHPIIYDKIINKTKIQSLHTGSQLIQEGIDMNHCVGSYIPLCIKGKSRIFSFTSLDNKKLATVEIVYSPATNSFIIAQVRGYANKFADKTLSTAMHAVAHTLCKEINAIKNAKSLMNTIYLVEDDKKVEHHVDDFNQISTHHWEYAF